MTQKILHNDPANLSATKVTEDEVLRLYTEALKRRSEAWDSDNFPAYKEAHLQVLDCLKEMNKGGGN